MTFDDTMPATHVLVGYDDDVFPRATDGDRLFIEVQSFITVWMLNGKMRHRMIRP